ncbi:MAG: hypothetical protein ACI4LX_05625 [Treponema sp.]
MGVNFFIDKQTPIILYGAATIGTLLYQKYQLWGLNITGFIDKRAEEIKNFIGLPVYAIENEKLDKPNVVVLIAVKNVFEHSRIASRLQKAGYKNVIFRPYNALNGNGSENENLLNEVYSHITEDNSFEFAIYKNIPFIDASSTGTLKEQGIIKKENGKVIFYLPVTMLFTDKKGVETERQHPVLCLKPHVNFCKFILGAGGEVQSLMDYCVKAAENIGTVKVTEAWKENVIANQSEVYLDMLHKYNVEPDFFINKAPNVIWNNECKYFNLNSGKHRASFLCAVGKNYIPVCASEEDYKKYLTTVNAESVQKKISAQFEDGLSYPVENPYFYDSSRYGEQFWFLLIRAVTERLGNWYYDSGKILEGLKVFNRLHQTEFLNIFFERMGCRINEKHNGSESYDVAFIDDFDKAATVKSEHYFVLCEKKQVNNNAKKILSLLNRQKMMYLYEC